VCVRLQVQVPAPQVPAAQPLQCAASRVGQYFHIQNVWHPNESRSSFISRSGIKALPFKKLKFLLIFVSFIKLQTTKLNYTEEETEETSFIF